MNYQINKDVLYEHFDGEVVIISLETGNYFSLTGLAADIWGWLAKGVPAVSIIDHITGHYQGDEKEIINSVHQFLVELIQDGLISEQEKDQATAENSVDKMTLSNSDGKPQFVPPKLERYTDMQALLLLDPIHDVGEEGWPNIPPEDNPQ